jgi:hypothetical protein
MYIIIEKHLWKKNELKGDYPLPPKYAFYRLDVIRMSSDRIPCGHWQSRDDIEVSIFSFHLFMSITPKIVILI